MEHVINKNNKNQNQTESYLGAIDYYRNIISYYSQLMYPFYQLLEKDATVSHNKQFLEIKNILLIDMELITPNFNIPFIIYMNASQISIGGAICQENQKGTEKVISFASRILNYLDLISHH